MQTPGVSPCAIQKAPSVLSASMLPAFAPSSDVGVAVGDALRNILKSDSLTDSQRSSGSFTELRSQARAALFTF